MSDIAFNVNDHVRVKLTDIGRRIYEQRFARLSIPLPPVDADGFSRFQLWDLMNIFGPGCRMGADPPFEMEIIIEAPPPPLAHLRRRG